jgi:hypothetical protein
MLMFIIRPWHQYDWGLYDLSIYIGRSRGAIEAVPVAETRENEMMRELLKYIPSVKSFKQRGDIVMP